MLLSTVIKYVQRLNTSLKLCSIYTVQAIVALLLHLSLVMIKLIYQIFVYFVQKNIEAIICNIFVLFVHGLLRLSSLLRAHFPLFYILTFFQIYISYCHPFIYLISPSPCWSSTFTSISYAEQRPSLGTCHLPLYLAVVLGFLFNNPGF